LRALRGGADRSAVTGELGACGCAEILLRDSENQLEIGVVLRFLPKSSFLIVLRLAFLIFT
ncbi:MAG: hypothetical protein WA621_17910, partial [Candidatus Acidiferrum sp.]